MISASALAIIVRRRARDEGSEVWSDDLILDAIREGLRALSDYAGVVSSTELESEDETVLEYDLPSDFIRLLEEPALFTPSTSSDSDIPEYLGRSSPGVGEPYYAPSEVGSALGYRIVGTQLQIWSGLDTGETLRIVYEAIWPDIEKLEDTMDLPWWAERALVHYVIFYMLSSEGVTQAVQAFYKDKMDSGNPSQNPALLGADWYKREFDRICEKHIRQGIG